MNKEQKQDIQLYASLILGTIGCGLLISAFVVFPMGEIHHTVLVAFGEIMTFVASVWGLHCYHTIKGNKEDKNKTE